jgi:hypothetical protein
MAKTFFSLFARAGTVRRSDRPVPEAPEPWMPPDVLAVLLSHRSDRLDPFPQQPEPPRLGRRLRPAPDAQLPVDVRAVVHDRLRA